MHPPLLDEAGLGPALRWYARGFAERSKIVVTVDIADDFGRASQEVETTVFRVVQEALTNVHRYSGSSTARIRVSRENGRLLAEVRDEGCGLTIKSDGPGLAGATGRGHRRDARTRATPEWRIRDRKRAGPGHHRPGDPTTQSRVRSRARSMKVRPRKLA